MTPLSWLRELDSESAHLSHAAAPNVNESSARDCRPIGDPCRASDNTHLMAPRARVSPTPFGAAEPRALSTPMWGDMDAWRGLVIKLDAV